MNLNSDELKNLGYDLLELTGLRYLYAGNSPEDCPKSCQLGCTPGCAQCLPGDKDGSVG